MADKLIGQQMKIASILLEKLINQRMTKIVPNLTPQQTIIMMMLYERPSHTEVQKAIEGELKTSHATTRGIIKRLEQAQMVTTSPAANDRRQSVVHLTSQGLQLMQEKHAAIAETFQLADQTLTAGISQADLTRFREILDRMLANL